MGEKENERQRYGRNKATVVNKHLLESGEFRRKFDLITDNAVINRKLYQLAKKMLLHRSGTKYEDMYWISQETGDIIASETQMNTEEEIKYSDNTKNVLKQKTGLVTIHSHPMGLPPSVNDFNANYKYGYCFGVVVGHNCRVFIYESEELINELYFSIVVAQYRRLGYNEAEAEVKAITHCMERYNITFKEVTLDVE